MMALLAEASKLWLHVEPRPAIMSGVKEHYPCPCCGYLAFSEPPGSYDICPICFWEDDLVQLRWPDYSGGANRPSLRDSQQNFIRFGAMEERFVKNVRGPGVGDRADDGWRPVDDARDSFERPGDQERPWPDDRTVLYWWRPTFWRLGG
ncbi:CPCC family cysteine-rich protein [Actinoplanes sp. NPDC049548]|uniref:CPCC family cysteine-rich protein n=1 Tax=Actinoplanes sp. NPDC049548 TaxID=3155152 RepID=UPI0034422BA9